MADWDCEAYGPKGRELGALCFVATLPGHRMCPDAATCHLVMTEERARVYGIIQDKAAAGDTLYAYLATCFTSPDQLLGGGDPGA